MTQTRYRVLEEYGYDVPDISHIEVEDGAAVDGFPSERGMRLLSDTLYVHPNIFGEGRSFLAAANVGLFYTLADPPYVPDVFVSLDVAHPGDLHLKQNRTYMIWEYGKVPEVVVEIVSNKKGGELEGKKAGYARLRIPYYIVHDPQLLLGKQELYVFALQQDGKYAERPDHWLPELELGVTIWEGEFEGIRSRWLRWCDIDGTLIATGAEAKQLAEREAEEARQRAHQEFERAENALELVIEERQRAEDEKQRAEQERQRAEDEKQRAEQERQRAELFAAKLRELGIDPNQP